MKVRTWTAVLLTGGFARRQRSKWRGCRAKENDRATDIEIAGNHRNLRCRHQSAGRYHDEHDVEQPEHW